MFNVELPLNQLFKRSCLLVYKLCVIKNYKLVTFEVSTFKPYNGIKPSSTKFLVNINNSSEPDMVGYVLVAHILDIDMPQTTACGGDHIEIRDGPYHDSPLVTR